MAISTQGVKLIAKGLTVDQSTENVDILIKSFPDLGAAPAAIEVTALADDVQKFIPGVKGMAAMEFVANYDETVFTKLINNENASHEFNVYFSSTLSYKFSGYHKVIIVGGALNAAVDMKITIMPNTKVEKV